MMAEDGSMREVLLQTITMRLFQNNTMNYMNYMNYRFFQFFSELVAFQRKKNEK
jgi:hypothetical protein